MMLEESSTNLMDQCFSTDATSPETVLRMLTLLHDCLSSEKTEIEPAGKSGRNQKTTGKPIAQCSVKMLTFRSEQNPKISTSPSLLETLPILLNLGRSLSLLLNGRWESLNVACTVPLASTRQLCNDTWIRFWNRPSPSLQIFRKLQWIS